MHDDFILLQILNSIDYAVRPLLGSTYPIYPITPDLIDRLRLRRICNNLFLRITLLLNNLSNLVIE
ncbi:hypothetical protein D3C85_1729040 [compost metagenome]